MDANEFLAHHGVKGMKWGKTKDEVVLRRLAGGNQIRASGGTHAERKAANAENKQAYKDYKKSVTKQELKADKKEARATKGSYLVEQSMKSPKSLVKTVDLQGNPLIMSGREFSEAALNGKAFNVKYTDIIARG